ncbi:aspartate aminotransferase family protein [soil metagenome]
MEIPKKSSAKGDVLAKLKGAREKDADWKGGRTFSLVYYAGEEVLSLLKDASMEYFSENALNPVAFPSLRRFETEVVSMAANMFHLPEAVGSMTSGGTESILMAIKTAREWGRAKGITEPEMILPITVHPAFEKAAAYFDVKPVHIPTDAAFRADLDAMKAAITKNTVILVGSAPQFPQGVVDPIDRIAAMAQEHGLLCHVDACVGGFMLPWIEKLGYPVPTWDFRVPGVTSISADIHKYGFAAKGASLVMYRTRELRRHQFCVYGDWPGGLWLSPTAAGTRPGGPIAAAWAVMNYLGEEGYLAIAKQTLETARKVMDGIRAIPGLRVLGEPHGSIFAFGPTETPPADAIDPYVLADAMQARGWSVDRQQFPPSLHMMITPAHAPHVDALLADLRAAATEVRGKPAIEGSAAMYGMMGTLPDRAQVKEFLLQFLDSLDS